MATADHQHELPQALPADNVDIEALPPTDFGAFVTHVLARTHHREAQAPSLASPTPSSSTSGSSSGSEKIDQKILRYCINLASSFLVTDMATNPAGGISTWFTGLARLVDLVIVLHKRNELEAETVSAASQACSECWTVAGNWRGLDDCRQRVREVGGKLKKILDSNERTYRGQRVYAP